MNFLLGWIVIVLNLSYLKASKNSQSPHIILIYADDLGWNDLSYHGSGQTPTPNIDALALNGITLQNYYGEWLCTPSRASLLTGKYPMRLGLQHIVILAGQPSGLPLNETTMPQYFKKFGYETHMIGKWHLGYQTKEYTPTYRGFDSFYGYWNGKIDYYDYTYLETDCSGFSQPFFGMDLRDGMMLVRDAQGKYATTLFTEKAEEIIMNHNTSKPLFMFFAHLAVHAGNSFQRSQAPGSVVSEYTYIADPNRRIHAAVVDQMDKSVGNVFKALHEKDMLENTIFLFVSDNGGQVIPGEGYGSNYPLKGSKETYWEGAIRLPAVIWSPLLNLKKPRVSHQLMHVSDWLPTLYTLMGGNVEDLGPIDGMDMWDALVDGTPSPRTEMLQNLDTVSNCSAYRQGHLKLTRGGTAFNNWSESTYLKDINSSNMYEWVFKNGSTVRDVLQEMGMWIVEDPEDVYQDLLVTCQEPPPENASQCNPGNKPCLFNITADPCEYYDIADQYPDTVQEMLEVIEQYASEAMKAQNTQACDASVNPLCHDFAYVPWLDPDQYRSCAATEDSSKGTTN